MKRYLKSIAATACIVLGLQTALAAPIVTVNDVMYYVTTSSGTAKVMGSTIDCPTDVVIAESVEYNGSNYPVTAIRSRAFQGMTTLTSVTMPATITEIENSAFEGCGLSAINLPDALQSIGSSAFSSNKFTSVSIPVSVNTIGMNAFRDCNALTSVTFEAGCRLTEIESGVFYNCSKLKTITIPAYVMSIGFDSFRGCANLTAFHVEDGNTSYSEVDGFLFSKDGKIVVECPPGITGEITIPGNPTTIGDNSFSHINVSSIKVPGSVTTINSNAFSNCSYLHSIDLGDQLATISIAAFQNCNHLQEVALPASVTTIGGFAFDGCVQLQRVSIKAIVPPTTSDTSFDTSIYQTATLTVPAVSLAVYKEAMVWKNFTKIETPYDLSSVMLSVALPNGTISFTLAGKQYTPIAIVADEGWMISTITLGDEDITALLGENGTYTVPALTESKTLRVVFVQDSHSGVESIVSNAVAPKVYVTNDKVRIEGAEPGAEVRVFDLNGRCLLTTRNHTFVAPGNGVHILTISGHTYKFSF